MESGRPLPGQPGDLVASLASRIVGQANALKFITPYVQMYRAGLSPNDRPAGTFLLLGPTGTGKTRTVEAFAEILHGNTKKLLRIDCAEYQSDHEVAKLIGAPPGYVGHRETAALLTAERLRDLVSNECDLAIVLFDEIEKAAPGLTALLLGLLDHATLRLGDNSTVNFEKTLIFLTSNLGAREMMKQVRPDIGFQQGEARPASDVAGRLENIGLAAVRKRFPPEFVNRIDVIVTYQPLDAVSLSEILDHHIADLQRHVHTRLGARSFEIDISPGARQRLVDRGASQEYGARELKRTIHRMLTQPLAALVADGRIDAGGRVFVDVSSDQEELTFRPEPAPASAKPAASAIRPTVLLVDDNGPLLKWLTHVVPQARVDVLAASTAQQARELGTSRQVHVAMLDLLLPDGDGLSLAFELLRLWPRMQVIIMTGTELSPHELALCSRQDFPVLQKPFLASDVMSVLQARLQAPAITTAP